MKKLALVFALGAAFALADSFSGVVSDSMCGAQHKAATAADKKCVEGCIKNHGSKPVLVVGDKVYRISADSEAKVMNHLGDKVKVEGTVSGDTITIQSVS
ncbi:MAG TPA: hypothetical protein VMJ34_15850 [Bryobacteraceae bacterium]|nr:hypothetical protein [Bryobacteraceae bacterium]